MEIIKRALSDAFDGCEIKYQHANGLHKFRIEWDPVHWLYIGEVFIEDHTEDEVIDSLHRFNVFDEFQNSEESRWLFLSEGSVREVDGEFGRGRP